MKTQSLWTSGLRLALFAATSTIIAFFSFGPMLGSQLGLIDDHEIIRFRILLGETFDVNKLVAAIKTLPDFVWGEARARPVYFFLRLLETYAWGDSAYLWYLSRVCQFALLLLIACMNTYFFLREKASRNTSTILAVIVVFLMASSNTFNDIVNRLGPSELYVANGILIFVLGLLCLLKNPKANLGWWISATGLVLAIGSKENAIILGPLLLVIGALLPTVNRVQASKLIPALLPALFAIYIGSGVALNSFLSGKDIYEQGRTLKQFVLSLALNPFFYSMLFMLCLMLLVIRRRRMDKQNYKVELLVFGVCAVVTIWESYFYQTWPFVTLDYSRYELISTIALFIAAIAVTRVFITSNHSRTPNQGRTTVIFGLTLGIAVTLTSTGGETIFSSRVQSQNLAMDLASQHAALVSLYQTQDKAPRTFVMMPKHFVDYEPIYALPQFTNFYTGQSNGFTLDSSGLASKARTAQELKLFEDLRSFEKAGNDSWNLIPLDTLRHEQKPTCIYFLKKEDNAPASDAICAKVVKIPIALPR